MLEAVTLISLLNTGANLVGSVAQSVGNAISGRGEASSVSLQNFSSLLSSTQSNAAIGLNAKTSLDITQQGSIVNNILPSSEALSTQNSEQITDANLEALNKILSNAKTSLDITQQGSIVNNILPSSEALSSQNSEQITDATLEALNKILSGDENPDNLEVLADDNTDGQLSDENNSGGILGNTKLNDPFGIEAAKANGYPIAVAIAPAESLANNVNPETGEVLASSDVNSKANNSLNSTAELQNKALPNNITIQNKAEATEETLDAEAANKLAAENLASKELKPSENKASSVQSGLEKIADKFIHNPNSPYYGLNIGKDENRAIGDAARSVRSKDSVQEKLADVDSYKVVNVSRKDNILDLRLEPAALGKVQIKFDFAADGKTNVMVIADRQETLDMMKRDSDSIQKLLTDNGIKAESGSLSFNLRGQQQNNDNFNFFSGKPISFGVQEELNKLAANDDLKSANLNGYGVYAGTGMLNIMV